MRSKPVISITERACLVPKPMPLPFVLGGFN